MIAEERTQLTRRFQYSLNLWQASIFFKPERPFEKTTPNKFTSNTPICSLPLTSRHCRIYFWLLGYKGALIAISKTPVAFWYGTHHPPESQRICTRMCPVLWWHGVTQHFSTETPPKRMAQKHNFFLSYWLGWWNLCERRASKNLYCERFGKKENALPVGGCFNTSNLTRIFFIVLGDYEALCRFPSLLRYLETVLFRSFCNDNRPHQRLSERG